MDGKEGCKINQKGSCWINLEQSFNLTYVTTFVAKDTKKSTDFNNLSCLWMNVQAQIHLSEQLIQNMIRQRIRKNEEVKQSVSNMKVE